MRLLILSNFYPPHAIGGMEHRCQETVERLRARGHEVAVLTSRYRSAAPDVPETHVYRLLHLESDLLHYQPLHFFTARRREERANQRHLARLVERWEPTLIFVWGMWNLPRSLAWRAERLRPGRVVYSLAQDWLVQPDAHTAYWQTPPRRRALRPLKRLVGRLVGATLARERAGQALRCERALCVSHALRDALLQRGAPLKEVRVVYPGIELEPFVRAARPAPVGGRALSLLYAGALAPHKGVHTAIAAIERLRAELPNADLRLTLVGQGHPDYRAALERQVAQASLEEWVRFEPPLPRAAMAQRLGHCDVLLFPSVWEEPFARIVLEAMAAGLVVIGTRTGGTGEILVEGETGLTFAPEDAAGLAAQIRCLLTDPAQRQALAHAGQRVVVERFGIERMVNQIESYLLEVARGSFAPLAPSDEGAAPLLPQVGPPAVLQNQVTL